ncbi:MAG: hypothetical protein GEU79_14925 [Acidimicrobiia bacterium]|nr:hypothetical protein [Acidimicrobiia bacterium]
MHVDIAHTMIEQQLAERRAEAAEDRKARELPIRPHTLKVGSLRFTVERDNDRIGRRVRLAG